MNLTTTLKYVVLTAGIVLPGLTGAIAAEVHTCNLSAMEQWYGRAGGLVGSDVVSEPQAWRRGGQSVQISFSQTVADWTNMPRNQAQVGPVTDSAGGHDHYGRTTTAMADHYGRAGNDELLEQMQMPR